MTRGGRQRQHRPLCPCPHPPGMLPHQLTASASLSHATSAGLRQVASPCGHWLLRRPARPAICFTMLTLTGTVFLPPAGAQGQHGGRLAQARKAPARDSG